MSRRLPVGAEITADGIEFRVWAPDQNELSILLSSGRRVPLSRSDDGYFSGRVTEEWPSLRYQLELGTGELIADPVSRFQPDGPHGPSQVIDSTRFQWTDAGWSGRPISEYIIYEMHIGTFTREGTWRAAIQELPELAAAGITALEVMPVADFPGKFGWGYDGVCLFAPTRLYGSPDEFREFVDAAHRHGLCVLLDVVYNHLGPDGNFLGRLSRDYFTERHTTEWGSALNFDGRNSGPVREFFLANAAYWISEFHLDGLRLDATQAICDDSIPSCHILTEIGCRARGAAKDRRVIIISENERQDAHLCRKLDDEGCGLDGAWNDDFHHSALVAMTGRNDAYYTDYRGDPQEFVSAAKYGFLFQGQWYSWQQISRGSSALRLSPVNFVYFLENHDQVANSARGLRVHQLTSPGRYRAFLTLLLLGPGTPMLFQGQEFQSSSPFLYFADHEPELAGLVEKGRGQFLAQFPGVADFGTAGIFARPHDSLTFERCKLDFRERQTHSDGYRLCKDLIGIRKTDPAFDPDQRLAVDGAVLGPEALVLRYFMNNGQDRILLINWGRNLRLQSMPEPLLAPPRRCEWRLTFSTDNISYGGQGIPGLVIDPGGWLLPGGAALWLIAESETSASTSGT